MVTLLFASSNRSELTRELEVKKKRKNSESIEEIKGRHINSSSG
jgi:hypothetical protein